MIKRHLQQKIEKTLRQFPAVAILGPRQAGKTTLAKKIAQDNGPSVYLDLERPSDLYKLKDPELFLNAQNKKLVVIDEIHRVPKLFQVLRGIIDERRMAGEKSWQFLLLGSASLDLVQSASETLAGRIAYMQLGGFTATEISNSAMNDRLWIRGGFPDSYLSTSDENSFIWRENFINSYLERDIPSFGSRVPAETLRRFWTMLAHNQGQLLNVSRIASALDMSVSTVQRYCDLLVDLLLVRPLRPWTGNIGKRLTKSPKLYIRDSGIVHTLLNLRSLDNVLGHQIAGSSWEGFVLENILSVAPPQAMPSFFRTSAGAEIDLILEIGADERIAIEIKKSLTPTVTKGFHNGCEDIKATRKIIIYPGTERYNLADNIEVLPLLEIMKEFEK